MPNVLVVRLVALVNRRSAFAALALSLSAAACDGAPTAAQPSLAVSRGSVPVGVALSAACRPRGCRL
jgi:hypothetical protein